MSKETENTEQQVEAADMPINILGQYITDLSFENPNASQMIMGPDEMPQMDLNIGMDARKIPHDQEDSLYEVVLNVKAEAMRDDKTMFIAELQYGATVSVNDEVPEENHHPLLLIEIPRLIFPFARQVLSATTVQGGYPPLLLNPVDFHGLYMQRFGEEIEAAKQELQEGLRDEVDAPAEEKAE